MAVKTGEIPPNVNFEKPNPKIDFDNSPFFVPTKLTKWTEPGATPRWREFFRHRRNEYATSSSRSRRAVTSEKTARTMHVALVSAKSSTALESACARLAEYLRANPDENIADVCHTLAIGRSLYPFARIALCRNAKEAVDALSSNDPAKVVSGERAAVGPPVTFLFPGQGSQHIYMARELYNEEPVFRQRNRPLRGTAQAASRLRSAHVDLSGGG